MAVSLKNAETIRLARELATLRETSVTQAITDALREELRRDDRLRKIRRRMKRGGKRVSLDVLERQLRSR